MKPNRLAVIGSVAGLAAVAGAQTPGLNDSPATYFGACVVGGVAALATPCVFPMIPVTVSYFTKRTERPIPSAVSYALGIISTFAIIGIATSALFGATGIQNFAANPWVNIAIGALFVVLALNLFGVYEVGLPSFLTSKLSQNTRKQGLVGPFFMGATFSLTSFTCTTAIVAGLLAQAATGNILRPALGMATFGATFALPFFLLALFPSGMSKMPKSGGWLAAVKPTLGFIEIAAAMKFFSNADLGLSAGYLTRPVFIASWVLIFGLMAGYLLGIPEKMKEVGWGRRLTGLATLGLVVFLMSGLQGNSLGSLSAYLPPDPYPVSGKTKSTVADATQPQTMVAGTYDEALQIAAKAGKPVFIDFTGVNCVNCRWMEENIFTKSQVKDRLAGFVRVQLYTDRPTKEDKANQDLQTKLVQNNALPTYVLLTPNGKYIEKSEGATPNPDEFAKFLDKAKSSS